MKFKKSLGQNLLVDKNILKKILSLTSFKNKNIIEIGAGTGNLSTGRSGCAGFGIQTAAVNVSGYTNPGSVTGAAEHYNGSTWTSGGALNTSEA